MRKSKEIKKKEMKVKSPVIKKEKKTKSKCNALGKLSLKYIYKENVFNLFSEFLLSLPLVSLQFASVHFWLKYIEESRVGWGRQDSNKSTEPHYLSGTSCVSPPFSTDSHPLR